MFYIYNSKDTNIFRNMNGQNVNHSFVGCIQKVSNSDSLTNQNIDRYVQVINEFKKKHDIKYICEIGFGSHSALILNLTYNSGAIYMAFDYLNSSDVQILKYIGRDFLTSNIHIIKVDPGVTIIEYNITKCDIIHINENSNNYLPSVQQLVKVNTLLIINDCNNLNHILPRADHRYIQCASYYEELYLPEDKLVKHFTNSNLKMTLVLMGYSPKRNSNYQKIFTNYGKLDKIIDQIIFLWCNKNHPAPKIAESKVPIYLEEPIDSLNSRFNVSHIVKTDAVMFVDDDILINDMLFNKLFKTWKANPHLLVGVDKRYTNAAGRYSLKPHYQNQSASITLTKTMMLHKYYLQMYMSNQKILKYVDSKFNGEDIAMNAVVQNHICALPVVISLKSKNDRIKLPEPDGMSIRKSSKIWINQRSSIVKWLQNHYHYNVFHCESASSN